MPRPLGTCTIASQAAGNCVLGAVLARDRCLLATVNVPDGVVDGAASAVAETTTDLKVTNPSGTSIGTIVCFGGQHNSGWFEQAHATVASVALTAAVTRGQRVIQNSWNIPTGAADPGWDIGATGFLVLACRTSTLLRAIFLDSTLHTPGTPFIVLAHSMGGYQICAGLAFHGTHEFIDLALLSSGPGNTRVDWETYGHDYPVWEAIGPGLCIAPNTAIGHGGGSTIDTSFGTRTYSTVKSVSGGIDNPGYASSLRRVDGIYNYRRTKIITYYGDQDNSSAVPAGRNFMSLVGSFKVENVIDQTGGDGHAEVPDNAASLIDADLAAAVYLH